MAFHHRALFAVTLAVAAAVAHADDLTTTNGKKIAGKLVAIDAHGVTFGTGEAQVKVPGKDVVVLDLGNKIAFAPKDTRIVEIELTDGSTFRTAKFVLKGKKVETDLFP